MSQLRVNYITNRTQDGRPILSVGASVGVGYALTANYLSISGQIFATSFSGDGSNLTNLPTITAPKVIALKRLGIWFDDYRF
jgi:hypothetical protein